MSKANATTTPTTYTPGPLEFVEGDMLTTAGTKKACWLTDEDGEVVAAVAVGSDDYDRCKAGLRHAALATQALPELLAELEDVEWAGLEDHPDGGHYPACPSCGGGDPDHPDTPEEYEGHADDCTLRAAIVKAKRQ